jgi:hypothetical protein
MWKVGDFSKEKRNKLYPSALQELKMIPCEDKGEA